MQLEDFFDFIGDPVEAIRLKGTRIDLEHVVCLHHQHMTPEQIAVHFARPMRLALVYAAITYYLENRTLVEAYLAQRKAVGDANLQAYLASPESPVARRLRDLKARLANDGPFTENELASDSFRRLRESSAAHRAGSPFGTTVADATKGVQEIGSTRPPGLT